MNPLFWLLVIAAAVAFWFVLAPAFRTIGEILLDFWERAKEEIYENKEDE